MREYIAKYEGIQRDVDAAMKAEIKIVRHINKGFARSPALTKAAGFVRFWRTQLSSTRNNTPLSNASRQFALMNNLPDSLQPISTIFRRLHQAWANLHLVQKCAAAAREEWLDGLASDAADETNTSKERALQQIVRENRLRRIYSKLKPIAKGKGSGALSSVKIPKFEWFHHESSNTLYHYVNGAFYAHARVPGVDNDFAPYRRQHTRRPLRNKTQFIGSQTCLLMIATYGRN